METLSKNLNYLVSVITPAYNSAKYIGECIESVLNQTYSNWELIIVNDKSTDNSQAIIEAYVEKDPRIKLLNQEKNMGVSAARNKALEGSKGRFVAFLDSDDVWDSRKLERQLEFMIRNNYGFTFTSYEIMSDKLVSKKKVIRVPQKVDYNQYLKNTIIGNSTVIMDTKLLGRISVEDGHLEDVLTWMKYLRKGYIAYGLNENLARYRVTANSVSSNKFKNAIRYFYCLRKKQKLSLGKSIYCQIGYMFNAIRKRLI